MSAARELAALDHAAASLAVRRARATNEGMLKGYWKVVLSDGTVVETSLRSKRFAVHIADEINRRGAFPTGISGFRREEKL